MRAPPAKGEDLKLTVYLQNTSTTDLMTLTAAKATTTKIFAGIGVRLHWATGNPRQNRRRRHRHAVRFRRAPARFRTEEKAPWHTATPFDDSHTSIHIFYDRVLASVPHQRAAALLRSRGWRTKSGTCWSA